MTVRRPRGLDSHGNKTGKRWIDSDPPILRKVPADSVPFGASISRNGKTVWAAYDGERLVSVAASAGEARRKYRDERTRERIREESGSTLKS